MAGKSNAKGSLFEREVCRQLTEWVTGSRTPEIFWRSATSGAKATQDYKAGRASKMGGDIIAVDPRGQPFIDRFSVECKDRASYGRLELVLEGRGQLNEWWEQCRMDALRSKRKPFMVFKQLRSKIYLMYNRYDLPLYCNDICRNIEWMDSGGHIVTMVVFEDWLRGISHKGLMGNVRIDKFKKFPGAC